MDTEALGLRPSYVFKQTHIPWAPDQGRIRLLLKDAIAPVIRDLESRRLIDGFHYIVHEQIDLRLSCHDWPQHEANIRHILKVHSVSADLRDYDDRVEMPPEKYGGETGVLLCFNNLEFNSRLCLALIELMSGTNDRTARQCLASLCPHQWVHYLCNQFAVLNSDQISFELHDALCWLRQSLSRLENARGRFSSEELHQERDALRSLLDNHKGEIKQIEEKFDGGSVDERNAD